MSYIRGIDVSSLQGTVDWQAVANSGVQFAICRCSVGNDGVDSHYAGNITGARAAGLYPACYNFIYPLPPSAQHPTRDPVLQATAHFNASGGELSCIDCEWPAPQDFSKWGVNPEFIREWLLQYLATYEQLSGRKPIIYTYPYWAQAVNFTEEFAQYPLWIASYENTPRIPKPWNDWVLWQNTGGGGHLPNSAPVDTNLARDLSLWGVSAAPQSQEPPVPEVSTTNTTTTDNTPPNDPIPPVNQAVAASNQNINAVNNNFISKLFALFKSFFTIFARR